jgi:hypothetical protein
VRNLGRISWLVPALFVVTGLGCGDGRGSGAVTTQPVTIEASSDRDGGWLTVPVSGTYRYTMDVVRPLDPRADPCIGRSFLLEGSAGKQPVQAIGNSTLMPIQGTSPIDAGRWHGVMVEPVMFGRGTLDPNCAWQLTLTLTGT